MSDLTPGASRNLGLAITMIALTAVAIALRFYAILFLLKQKPQWADWVCILAACSFYVYCAIIINCTLPRCSFNAWRRLLTGGFLFSHLQRLAIPRL